MQPTPKTLRFRAPIAIRGINPYILISPARAKSLKTPWRKPMPVLVRINGQPKTPWPINMMPTGNGSFYLYLANTVRHASHTKVGDTVPVELRFNTQYRNGPQHPLPPWFRTALAKNPTAKKAWQNLPPSRQKEILRYFATLKSQEAKSRNLGKLLSALSGTTTRFMARTWRSGK